MYLQFQCEAEDKYKAVLKIASDLRKYAYDATIDDILGTIVNVDAPDQDPEYLENVRREQMGEQLDKMQ